MSETDVIREQGEGVRSFAHLQRQVEKPDGFQPSAETANWL